MQIVPIFKIIYPLFLPFFLSHQHEKATAHALHNKEGNGLISHSATDPGVTTSPSNLTETSFVSNGGVNAPMLRDRPRV